MPEIGFTRPTLQALKDRVADDLEASLADSDARLPRGLLRGVAYMVAGASHALHGLAVFVARQILPDTAVSSYLDRHASIEGLSRNAAVAATGSVDFTGVNTTVIPAGTEITRADGESYTTDALGTISGGTATIAVTATTAGADGNAAAATAVTIVTSITDIDSDAVVASGGLTGGADIETDDALRDRVVRRRQRTPQGGALDDYVAWSEDVDAVTRAWAYSNPRGVGTVDVYAIVADASGDPGIPSGATVTAIQAAIDAERPVTADVVAAAAVANSIDYTIALGTADTAALRTAVEDALRAMNLRLAGQVASVELSDIWFTLGGVDGLSADVDFTVPSASTALADGEVPTLGTVTWA